MGAVHIISVLFICLLLNSDVCAVPFRLSQMNTKKLSQHFTEYGLSCLSNHSISFEDIQRLTDFKMPQGKDVPCFFACILKKAKLMDDKGKIPPDAVLRVISTVFENENDKKEAIEVFRACSYVNDAPVKDGTKGCERAMLALKCLVDQSKTDRTLDEEQDVNDNNTEAPPRNNIAKIIVEGITRNILRYSCSGFTTVTKLFPFNMLSDILPTDTFAGLCNLMISFTNQ